MPISRWSDGRVGSAVARFAPALPAVLFTLAFWPSEAGAGWSEPRALSPVAYYTWYSHDVAANSRGHAMVAWFRDVDHMTRVIEGVRRNPGGDWGGVETFTDWALGRPPGTAVSERGDFGIVWSRETTVAGRILPVGESAAVEFSLRGNNYTPEHAKIGFDAAGDATVFWSQGSRVWTAERPAGGGFSSPVGVPNPGRHAHAPAYAVAANGDAVAAWKDYDGVYAAVRRGSGPFESVRLSAPSDPLGWTDVAINARGDAVAAWMECVSGCQDHWVMAAYRPAGGRFGAPMAIADAAVYGYRVPVAIDAAGRATVVVSGFPSGRGDAVWAVTAPPGGRFGSWEKVGDLPGCVADAATDAQGNTYVVWFRYDGVCQGGDSREYGAVRPAGGSFSGQATMLSGGGNVMPPTVTGFGPAGAIAAWPRGRLAPTYELRIEAATFEPDPSPGGGGAATPPDTVLTAGPSGTTASREARFEFGSPSAGASFDCRLDGGAWTACTSPRLYTGLSDAEHTFSVRAKDTAGNVDPTPAERRWRIDTAAPDTTVISAPSTLTRTRDASFEFASPEPGVSFECRLDEGAWSACSSPALYARLSDGEHSFAVRATDAVGNVDPTPSVHVWRIDTIRPETTIIAGPPATTHATDARFEFESSEPGSTFLCWFDGATAWSPCSSPQTYERLSRGRHYFGVRAVDAAGNSDGYPAERLWVVESATSPRTPAPPRIAPAPPWLPLSEDGRMTVSVAIPHLSGLATTLRRGHRAKVMCSEACRIAATLTLGRRQARRVGLSSGGPVVVARGAATVSDRKATVLVARFSRRARRAMFRHRRLSLTYHLRATDQRDASSTFVRRVVLRRR